MKELENFKFATLKNVQVKVAELNSGEIQVEIEPVQTKEYHAISMPITITYKPIDHYEDGTFTLKDDHKKKITIERVYAVASRDDIDWDFESIYPCDACARKQDWIRKLEAKVENLKGIINKLID